MLSTVVRFPTSPLLRVHSEVAEMFADEMDMLSLSNWRATCWINYEHGSSSLRKTLTKLLRPFVAFPHQLVDIVTKHGAVFGGEVALSFMLRNQHYVPSFLEIYASHYQFDFLCDAILDDPSIQGWLESYSFTPHEQMHALRRLVAESLVIHTNRGKTIYIHQSFTSSPCGPISRAPCTALSNYVTGYGFGCSHPELTFSKKALLADLRLVFISPHDALSINQLLAHNFSLAVSPTAWPLFRRGDDETDLINPEQCWRDRYICPNQGRFFGDDGSLVGYFDPLRGDEDLCFQKNIAPYGPMMVWRIMSSFDCDDRCEYFDEILEHGVTSVPVIFKKDPFGELWNCISDRSMRRASSRKYSGRRRSSSL